MKASETRMQPLIEGTKQYLVPMFQRPYSWEKRQWQTLWKDIVNLSGEDGGKSHFMGAIVTMPAQTVPEGITKYLLIDGQQRLSTLLLLLAAIRDTARSFSGTLADKIHELFLTNKYQEELDLYKLLPTQGDRDSFLSVIDHKSQSGDTRIAAAYKYFIKQIAQFDRDKLDHLFSVVTGKLFFVSIVLSDEDNAYVIFESLNFKGMPLTQADLIRNYFLMKVHAKKQENVFIKLWRPMQDLLADTLTEFFRHFLTMKHEQFVKKDEVYYTLKTTTETLTESGIISYLEEMNAFARYYALLSCRSVEPNPVIYKKLRSLNSLEVTTAYPFLLRLYHDYVTTTMTPDDLSAALTALESFVVRRYVCSVPTHGLNKLFPGIYHAAKQAPSLLQGITELLAKHCPFDSEFKPLFAKRKMYGTGEKLAKARLILERLEDAIGHKEHVSTDKLQIEHIMPQTLTDWWKEHLGPKWEAIHAEYLDSIGNLTLTGFNPELSNLPFDNKRLIYLESHIELTKLLGSHLHWKAPDIQQRSGRLSEMAADIWPALGPEPDIGNVETELPSEAMDTDDPAMSYSRLAHLLGGGDRASTSEAVYKLNDGRIILATVSRHHLKHKNFWYGISPSRLDILDKEMCSHVAFGMGSQRIAVVPVAIVRKCIPDCGISKNKDGTVKHYHFTISDDVSPELIYSVNAPRISLTAFVFIASDENEDTEGE